MLFFLVYRVLRARYAATVIPPPLCVGLHFLLRCWVVTPFTLYATFRSAPAISPRLRHCLRCLHTVGAVQVYCRVRVVPLLLRIAAVVHLVYCRGNISFGLSIFFRLTYIHALLVVVQVRLRFG